MACHWKGGEMARCLVENVEQFHGVSVYRYCPYKIPALFSKFHGVWQYIVIVPKKTSSIIEVNDGKRLLISSHLGNYHHMDSSLIHSNHLG
jgi:hypothetical protein